MDGSGAALLHSDYLVLLAALRGMVIHHWVDDRTRVRAEIMRFIALVEHDRPRDVLFQGAFDVARSPVVLGRPFCALHRVELLILNDDVGRNEATAAMCRSEHES